MKKIFSCLLSCAVMLSEASVLATEYDLNNNSVSEITDNTYSTIVILKADDSEDYDNIVYIGQAVGDSMFSSAVRFLLRDAPEEGNYIVKLGGKVGDTSVDTLEFYIGSPMTYGDEQYAKTWRENDTAAFAWESVDNISQYQSLLIQIDDRIFGLDISEFGNIDGTISLGMKLTELPEGTKSINAYLSKKGITDNSLDIGDN